MEGDSAWKALHDVLFGLFGCGSFVLGAAVCCLAVQYTRGEDLLPKIFKLVLGLVFACGTPVMIAEPSQIVVVGFFSKYFPIAHSKNKQAATEVAVTIRAPSPKK